MNNQETGLAWPLGLALERLPLPSLAASFDTLNAGASACAHLARYRLQADEKSELVERLQPKCLAPYADCDFKSFADYALERTRTLQGFLEPVRERCFTKNKLGFLLVENLPCDLLQRDSKRSSISELMLLAVALALGQPFNYESRRSRSLINNMIPSPQDASAQLGTNSVDLFWHTEDAHLDYNSDYFALFCLRDDPAARTLISCLDVGELEESVRARLAEPHYRIFPDGSMLSLQGGRTGPILDLSRETPALHFDPLYTACADEAARSALESLLAHLNERAVSIQLKPGDLLIVDNRRSVHARTSFHPRYDGADRWVQRILIFEKSVPAELIDGERAYLLKC